MSQELPVPHWMIPAFTFFQLHYGKANPQHYINIRLLHNVRPYPDPKTARLRVNETKSVFNKNIQIAEWPEKFHKEIYPKMCMENANAARPANIYFGVNLRTTPHGNKKTDCGGFTALFLDMDSHKTYTMLQRWFQIQFFIDFGIPPTFVLGSGNGYHVYWVLTGYAATPEGEAVLKRMVALAGCAGGQGGNTFDVTRVLRVPGFYNQKQWWADRERGETAPVCQIVWPLNWHESMQNKVPLPRYDFELFKNFPPCELGDIEKYKNSALKVHPDNDAKTAEYMRQIVAEHGRLHAAGKIQLEAQQLHQTTQQQTAAVTGDAPPRVDWQPSLDIVPDIDDLKFGRGRAWMRNYCKKGFDGSHQKEMDKIQKKYLLDAAPSASELDAKVIHELIRQGYTEIASREFWCRSDLKLYRPDKEKRSPNYFHDTYEKMLGMVQSVLVDGSANAAIKDRIADQVIIQQDQTYIRKNDGTLELILNANLILKTIYNNEDSKDEENREWYKIEATVPTHFLEEGSVTYPLFLPRSAFNEIGKFNKCLYDRMTLVTDKGANLRRVLNHMLTTYHDVPRKGFHTKMIYKDGKYIFPAFVVSKDAIVETNVIKESRQLQDKFPNWDWMTDKIATQDEVQAVISKNWPHIVNMHSPSLICSTLGMIAATAARPLLEEAGMDTFHMPTLNIRGSSHSGKTETVMKLMSLTGLKGDKFKQSLKSTEFGISALISLMPVMPIVIDEFKIEDGNERSISIIRDLIRRNYSGESATRGRADQSINITQTHGSLIVIGESPVERMGNISEISRLLTVSTYNVNMEKHLPHFLQVDRGSLTKVGPYFFQFLLQQDRGELLKKFNELQSECVERAGAFLAAERLRIGHNVAVIAFGCWLWEKFVSKFYQPATGLLSNLDPITVMLANLEKWAKDEGQVAQVVEVVGDKTYARSVIINESLQFVREVSRLIRYKDDEIIKIEDKVIPLYAEHEKNDTLYFHFGVLYEAYKRYQMKTRAPIISVSVLRNQFKAAIEKQEPYILDYSRTCKVDGRSVRCIVFKLSILRQMGVWEPRLITSKGENGDAAKEPENPTMGGKNRIVGMFGDEAPPAN